MASSGKMRVVVLASEWGSNHGELSTFNRELAIQLAKHPDVQVSVFLPRCDQDEKNEALRHNITLVEAIRRPGFDDETQWLCFPPKDLQIDFVIGHGVALGRHANIIRETRNCKWVQFVHTDPEERGMFKDCSGAISEGEKKRQDEVDLCVNADFVVAVGPKVAEAYRSYLQFCEKDQNIFVLTPGIFTDFSNIAQSKQDRSKCRVLAFGHGHAEDFSLKGLDIAARAVAKLSDAHLIFTDAKQPNEVADQLQACSIPPSRLRVRSSTENRERLKKQFSEVDLAIMPSRTEGFGLTALEAMCAGLPVLVSANSGFGEAMREVAFGSQWVIDSDDADVWAAEIKKVWTKSREIRLQELKAACDSYAKRYNWEEQCRDLVEKMRCILNVSAGAGFTVPQIVEQQPDADLPQAVSQPQPTNRPQHSEERNVSRRNQEGAVKLVKLSTDTAKRSGKREIPLESDQDTSEEGASSTRRESPSISGTIPNLGTLIRLIIATQDLNDEQQKTVYEILALQTHAYVKSRNLSTAELELVGAFIEHVENVYDLALVSANVGSLKIVLRCRTLKGLEQLWSDFLSGHLNEVAERYLVNDAIKREVKMETIRLKTTVEKENYLMCKKALMEMSEDKKPGNPSEKDQENRDGRTGASAEDHRYSDPLFRSERATWQTVPTRGQQTRLRKGQHSTVTGTSRRGRIPRRGASSRSVPPQRQYSKGDDRGVDHGRGQRGRWSNRATGRSHGKGGLGAVPRPRFDSVSHGFTQPDIKYEWNKLYVLGLHYRASPDSVKNYIELISGYEVSYVEWFKPNGKAIVTLKTDKIRDFHKILEAAEKRPHEGAKVLIERAPECKSIYVSEFSDDTSKEQVQMYFEREVGALNPARGVVFSPLWDEEEQNKRCKRAIVYFKDKKSVKRAMKTDHFLDDKTLHVVAFYPFMGTLDPVEPPKGLTRPTSIEATRQPEFYKAVEPDIMEFVMTSNQEGKLKGALDVGEPSRIRWTRGDRYALTKYVGKDKELDENAWKKSCSGIINSFLDNCGAREFLVEEEIWDEVANQLPQIERVLPKFTALVKLVEPHTLKLICQKSNMSDFEKKLMNRLKEIKQEELEKKLEQKTKTDISSERLQLLQNARIEDILKKEFNEDVRAEVHLGSRSLIIKTPKGLMASVQSHLKHRLEEIDQNSISSPPEILDILKTKVGKRKMTAELPEGCAFNVDEKTHRVILLGKTPSETREGRERAEKVLVSDRSLSVSDKDNSLIGSEKWKDLCKKLEKRLKIRQKRELGCIAIFGFKQDVAEAVTKMRDFLNEKKATEGEFRLESSIHRRFFTEFYRDDLNEIERELTHYNVKISLDESGNLISFSGSEDGVKEVEERLYAMQDEIKEKAFNITTPGMRNLLAQDEGHRLIATVEREHKCVINITENTGGHGEHDESDSEEPLSASSDGEEETDENEETILTSEGKKVIWKTGNIEEEQADILVCSVGSNFNLSIGAIANAMSKAAGPALQEALRELKDVTAVLGEGDIIHTIPGKLPCRHVIHCVCCPWKGSAEQEQILRELMRKCFDKASELGACSIGIPLIGTGNLGFPYQTAVQIMIKAAVDYSKANPDSPLEEFRFIVFGGDQKGISTFEEKFAEFKKEHQPGPKHRKQTVRKRSPTPILPEFRCKEVAIGDLKLKVVKGDITQECSHAICNVVTQDLDMTSGNLSRAISDVSGSAVQEALQCKSPQSPGSVVITTAGSLSAKHIVHMVVGSGNKQHLQKCVEKALKEVDTAGLSSVSIPAVGSGGLGLTPEDSADVVFGAIRAFTAKPCNSIHEMRVVVFDDSVTGAFVKELEAIRSINVDLSNCKDKDEDPVYCEGALEVSADDFRSPRRQKVIIYGRTKAFDAAMVALKDGVTRACNKPHVIKHEVIGHLSKRCIRDLKRMSRDRDVKLEQPESDTIILEGLPKDVMHMNSEVSNIIQEQMERAHKEEKAEQMSRTVQWYMVGASGKDEPFDIMANNDIELAYQAKKPSLLFTHQNLKAEINFGNKEVTFLRNGKIKLVRRRDVLPLPVEWDPQPRDDSGKEEIVYLASLAWDSQEFKRVEEKFLQSLRGKVSIKNIERIQNPSMYISYMLRKQTMDDKNGTLDNELHLFHGTAYDSVKAINVQGFNRSLCGRNAAAYGDGVYFAKDASYSLTYSLPGPRNERCMYLARVLVGKYTAGKQGMKTPPPRDPSKPELLFDSVVNTEQNPTIFVVFNDYHVYPEYLITF